MTRRRLFTIASAMSVLLCVATAVLWVRSYWTADVILLPKAEWWRRYTVNSDFGTVIVWTEVLRPPSDKPYWEGYPLDMSRTKRVREERAHDIPWTGFAIHSSGVAHQLLMISVPYWSFVTLTAALPIAWSLSRSRQPAKSPAPAEKSPRTP